MNRFVCRIAIIALASCLLARSVSSSQFGVLGRGASRHLGIYNLVADGDSITAGLGLSAGQDWPSVALPLLPASSQMTNVAVSGTTLAVMDANGAADVDVLLSATKTNIVVCFGGTNDIYFNADADDTAATTIARVQTYATHRRAAGWKVVVSTLLPLNNFPGSSSLPGTPTQQKAHHEARRQAFNTWLRANWTTIADGIADPGNDATMGINGDEMSATYYQSDHVHPTAAGQVILAGIQANAILRSA